jgi:hypothetical protein
MIPAMVVRDAQDTSFPADPPAQPDSGWVIASRKNRTAWFKV